MKNQMTFKYLKYLIVITVAMRVCISEGNCPRNFWHKEKHTACLEKSPELIESLYVSEKDKNAIVDMHNAYRSSVKPPACNMFKMYWDNELAYVAQKWADNCEYKHDENSKRSIPLKYSVGQNIAAGFPNWENVVFAWHSEGRNYKFGNKKLKNTGHYTQIVWSTSLLIGCGASRCSFIGTLYVCNYAPAGNTYGQDPYRRCQIKRPLNDCGNSPCYNFGTLNRLDCSCHCLNYHQIHGPRCMINCSFSDPIFPCRLRTHESCKYTNVRPTCPWLCKECNKGFLSRRTNWVLLCAAHILRIIMYSDYH
ncbi:cysteine-rich venom protein pseudecin [Octopus bimaculoides]|uniref:SCP domain-containing protein n=1 Tax=Octopus bimaculoides TaxID=37653 RepID=A0A0L8H9Q2_OCTBM|nr:cysteine-rich venom protein pseudecin [Octopus bimaculoides]|eukprot:XP_014774224.1 PREDICTED: cysteine-rich venom protein pseudecin-like [Octopus bimaculoides]